MTKAEQWFSFDGESFEVHNSEEEARHYAEQAMDTWSDDASDGWDPCSTQVCYGKLTHAVRVDTRRVTDESRHLAPANCDAVEEHFLEPLEDVELIEFAG